MIEVPQEVQEILKSDSTHKEFVVHFPNGECPDITNENIVSESVKFEESICSQQQFKYGLAEASALEFEFVDKFYPAGQQFPALEDVFPKEMTDDVTVKRADGGSFNVSFHYWAEDYPDRIYGGSFSPDMVVQTLSDARARISATIGSAYTGRIIYSCLPFTPNPNYPVIVVTEGGKIVTEEKAEPSYKYGNIKGMEIEAGVSYDLSTPYVKRVQIPPLDQLQERIIGTLSGSAAGTPVISSVDIVKDTAQGRVGLKMRLYEVDGDWYAERDWPYDVPSGTISATLDINPAVFASVGNGLIRDFIAAGKSPQTTLYYMLDAENYNGFLNVTETTMDNVSTTLTHYEDEVHNSWTIPYGVFKVDSCPRNHGAMTHRKVTAYSQSVSTNDNLPGYEKYKLQKLGWPTSSLTYDAHDLIKTWIRQIDKIDAIESYEGPTANNGEKLKVNTYRTEYDDDVITFGVDVIKPGALEWSQEYIEFWGDVSRLPYSQGSSRSYDKFGYIKRKHLTIEEIKTFMDELVESRYNYLLSIGCTINAWHYDQKRDEIAEAVYKYANSIILTDYKRTDVKYLYELYLGAEQSEYINFPNELYTRASIRGIQIARVTNICIRGGANEYGVLPGGRTRQFLELPAHDIYRLSGSSDADIPVTFNSTLDTKKSGSQTRYYYYNSYSYKAMFDGLLELTAEYARPSRYGGLIPVEMNDNNPYRIIPSDYSECWWDEYTVEPIGAIKYKFTQNGKETEVTYTIGDGTSVYDMGSNAFIDALANKSVAAVNALLDQYFIPKLQYIRFVPADITMRALPFLEAGDCLEIEAEDGTIIKTYIMHQTIDGIQSLEADISSVDGSIIETDTNSEIEEETT